MLLKRSYCYHRVKEDAINQGNKTMKIHVQPAYSRACTFAKWFDFRKLIVFWTNTSIEKKTISKHTQ